MILVHAEALEVEGLAVDEEPGPVDPHGADADRQEVAVDEACVRVDEVDPQVVEVAAPRLPQADIGTRSSTVRAACLGDDGAVGVASA